VLRLNPNPNVQTLAFLRKADISIQSTGTSSENRSMIPPIKFDGPCIIKIQGIASAADVDCEAGFNLEIVDN